MQRGVASLVCGAEAVIDQHALQPCARKPQSRLHGAKRELEPLRNGAVGKALEKGELNQRQLLLRQGAQRAVHIFLPLPQVEALVAAGGRIGNGEKIFGREAALATAALHVDAAIARDLKHPGDSRREAAIVEMRLLPDRFHHVLRQILGRRRSEA